MPRRISYYAADMLCFLIAALHIFAFHAAIRYAVCCHAMRFFIGFRCYAADIFSAMPLMLMLRHSRFACRHAAASLLTLLRRVACLCCFTYARRARCAAICASVLLLLMRRLRAMLRHRFSLSLLPPDAAAGCHYATAIFIRSPICRQQPLRSAALMPRLYFHAVFDLIENIYGGRCCVRR